MAMWSKMKHQLKERFGEDYPSFLRFLWVEYLIGTICMAWLFYEITTWTLTPSQFEISIPVVPVLVLGAYSWWGRRKWKVKTRLKKTYFKKWVDVPYPVVLGTAVLTMAAYKMIFFVG
ncbi:hypothetical protein [Paludifilum halophilum]|nr:hypothetical protein [Paludifilum halophilum]